MKLSDVCTAYDYLQHYDRRINWEEVQQRFPKVASLYQALCIEFRKICGTPIGMIFQSLEQIFRIDAQLQIIDEVFQQKNYLIEKLFTDDELVDMIERGKDSFYRELIGLKITDQPPWGLIFLSDRVIEDE